MVSSHAAASAAIGGGAARTAAAAGGSRSADSGLRALRALGARCAGMLPFAARGVACAPVVATAEAEGAAPVRRHSFQGKHGRTKRKDERALTKHPRERSKRMERVGAHPVHNWHGEVVGSAALDKRVWGRPLMIDVVHNVTKWQLAKRRAGTASVKKYWELRRTKKKPHPQKGTGRARQGDYRGPHMRGGITMFGPRPKDWSYPLPRKVRRLGVQVALSERRREGRLLIVDSLEPPEVKTKVAKEFMERVGGNKLLLIDGALPDGAKGGGRESEAGVETDDLAARTPIMQQLDADGKAFYDASTGRWAGELPEPSEGLVLACRNVPYMKIMPPQGINAYDVVKADTIVMSADALRYVQVRLTRPILRRPKHAEYSGTLGSVEEQGFPTGAPLGGDGSA